MPELRTCPECGKEEWPEIDEDAGYERNICFNCGARYGAEVTKPKPKKKPAAKKKTKPRKA